MHALMETFTHAVEWLRAQGPATLPLAFLVFVLANAAMAPASVLTVALGFVYGFVPGFLVAVLARPSAGIVACMVGRTLLRTRVQAVADRYPVFTAVDRALSSGGMRVIVLLRLSPLISSTVVNWLLGLTRVTLRDFAIGSALGIIPSTLAYTYLGSGLSAAREIFSERKEDPFHTALLVLGLIATVACVVIVSKLARRELVKELARGQATG